MKADNLRFPEQDLSSFSLDRLTFARDPNLIPAITAAANVEAIDVLRCPVSEGFGLGKILRASLQLRTRADVSGRFNNRRPKTAWPSARSFASENHAVDLSVPERLLHHSGSGPVPRKDPY